MEQEYCLQEFKRVFEGNRKSWGRLAIYGTGVNTRYILENIPQLELAGIMDGTNRDAKIWGYRNLSLLEVDHLAKEVDTVLVIARKSVQGIIYARIAGLEDEGIKIVNIEGERLGKPREDFLPENLTEWQQDETWIKRMVDEHDVISFDLFDTLLMRTVYGPQDLLEENSSEDSATDTALFEKEKNCIRKRDAICRLYEYALSNGKEVFILSDMYYSSGQLKELAQEAGLVLDKERILVSSELGVSKEPDGEAFEILRKKANSERILHIGDNYRYDRDAALKKGLNAIRIFSAEELLLHSSCSGLLTEICEDSKRTLLGMWKYLLFENPFSLNPGKGKMAITNAYQLGIYLGPVFYSVLSWLLESCRNENIDSLLLPGRDGWLIKEMLDLEERNFPYTYFSASRKAYQESINEEKQKEYLLAYLRKTGIEEMIGAGTKVALFDCLARGSVQNAIEQLYGKKLLGLYLGTYEGSAKCEIKSMFGETGNYGKRNAVLDHYLILENLLSEPAGGLNGFDETGEPIIGENAPASGIREVQSGILDFCREMRVSKTGPKISVQLCEELMELLFSGSVDVSEEVKELFLYEDSEMGVMKAQRIWDKI